MKSGPAATDTSAQTEVTTRKEPFTSAQATHALIERLKTDEAFRDRLFAIRDPGERMELVKAEGFDCSHEDIASFGKALADADLADVAAGLWDVCSTNTCSADCTAHSGW